jgi:hypothetical protein
MPQKDFCVLCLKETEYNISTHIDFRRHYVEGVGQLCDGCHDRISGAGTDKGTETTPRPEAKK